MTRASIDTAYEGTLQFVGGRTVNLPIISLLQDSIASREAQIGQVAIPHLFSIPSNNVDS